MKDKDAAQQLGKPDHQSSLNFLENILKVHLCISIMFQRPFFYRILVSVIFLQRNFRYFSSFYLVNLTTIYLEPEFDKILFKNISLSLHSCSARPPGIKVCCGEINLSRFLLYSDYICNIHVEMDP